MTKEALLREIRELRREIDGLKAHKPSKKGLKGAAPMTALDPLDVLQSVLDNTLAAIHIKDTEGRYLMVNRWFEKHTRFTRKKLIGRTPYDLFPREIVDALLQADKRVIKTGKPFEAEEEIPLEDGVHAFISAKFPIFDSNGRVRAVCGIATDITERKKTEEALRRSEASLRNAQRIARFGSWEWNIVNNKIHRSDEIYRIFGVKKGDLSPDFNAFMNIVHPGDRAVVKQAVDDALCGSGLFNVDYRVIRRNGSVRLVHSEGETVFDDAGSPVFMFGTAQDITDLKENERKYLDQLRFLQTLVDTIPSPIFYKDASGKYLGCNAAFEKFIGLSGHEIEGRTVYGVAPKALADKYREMDLALMRKGGAQRYESRVRHSDGSLRDIIFNKAVFKNSGGEAAGLVGVMLDVTDLRRAAAEKEEIMARLAECREKDADALRELAGVIQSLRRSAGKKETGINELREGLKKAMALTKKCRAACPRK